MHKKPQTLLRFLFQITKETLTPFKITHVKITYTLNKLIKEWILFLMRYLGSKFAFE